MKKIIYHIGDWHGDYKGLEKAIVDAQFYKEDQANDLDPDLLVMTGDLCRDYHLPPRPWDLVAQKEDLGECIGMINNVISSETPLVMVPGNHDFIPFEHISIAHSFNSTGPKLIEINGIKILGFRGVPYINGRWSCEFDDHHFDALINTLPTEGVDILVTHSPPYRVMDMCYSGEHVGIGGLQGYCDKVGVKAHFFGHIHEAKNLGTINKCQYSNASFSFHRVEIDV